MSAEVVETPFGKFLIHPQDLIGQTTKAGTLWDGHCLAPIALEHGRIGKEGVTILDVGANIGTFSVWLARAGAWRVIAVEAHPEIMLMLKANLDLNKKFVLEHVIPLELAAYSHHCRLTQGRLDPLEGDGNIGAHYVVEGEYGVPVLGQPLDDYQHLFGQRVSLIKLDIEGSEYRALLGLRQTIERDHPVIVFEWFEDRTVLTYTPPGTYAEIVQFLADYGYTVHPWPTLPSNYLALPPRRDPPEASLV